MEENKFISVKGYGQTFCHACLSGDRTLFPLGKYTNVYYNIFSNFAVNNSPHKLVCWECAALLRRVKQFQAKVELSQRLLMSSFAEKQTPLPTLSRLASFFVQPELTININFDEETDDKSQIEVFTPNITNEIFDKGHENNNLINNVQVKEENTYDLDYSMDLNDDLLDAIKTEEDNNIKIDETSFSNSRKKYSRVNKRKEFKIISKITRKELKEMCTTVYIGFDEIKDLLKKEADSDSYNYRYKCKSCVLSWPKVEYLRRHDEKFHKTVGKFVCDYCGCRFPQKRLVQRHVMRHRVVLRCACGRSAPPEPMVRHLAHAHRVRCNACPATFRTVHLFYKHYKQYHELFICGYCGRKCRLRSILEKHIKNLHGEKYRCDICNIEFKNKTTYKGHNARKHVVSGGEEAYCVECDRQFANVHLYRAHMSAWVAHQRDKDGARKKRRCLCPECGKVYARRESMRNHYNFVHMKKSKYVCLECDVQFLNRTKYVNHMQFKHEGRQKAKNKLCNICGRGFTTNKILTNHIRTHTGERPYSCAQCPARFTQKHAMLSHVAHVHLKVKRNTHAKATAIGQ